MKTSITTVAASALLGLVALPGAASAQEAILGEIRAFPYASNGGWCPRGWTPATGGLLQIVDNQALYSLFGTAYGGDGRTNFGLPDLRGRAAVGTGSGTMGAIPNVTLGQKAGASQVTLTVDNLPSHTHDGVMVASDSPPVTGTAEGNSLGTFAPNQPRYAEGGDVDVVMAPGTVQVESTGGSEPVITIDPFLGMNFCVATVGLYPSRN